MSIKIAKIKNYLKETYQKLGEVFYSNYWNLGYINCLKDEGKISEIEFAGLSGYNDKLYFVEDMRIRGRRAEIKREQEAEKPDCYSDWKEESKEMELERIKKRIDESIRKCSTVVLGPGNICPADLIEKLSEGQKVSEMYKRLIVRIYLIIDDGAPFRIRRIIEYIQELEDKYYPKPKITKEKINDIKESIHNYVICGKIERAIGDDIISSLDEIEG